jgi:hypothetical protein
MYWNNSSFFKDKFMVSITVFATIFTTLAYLMVML